MLRSAVVAVVVLVVAACSGGTAPTAAPTSGPTSGPTAAPSAAPSAAPTTAPTAVTTPAGSPTIPPSSGPAAELCGDDWSSPGSACGVGVGERLLFECPPVGSPTTLWGTDIYTSDSSVCTAAVHAGLINVAAGGAVTIEIRPGEEQYLGSTRNGVTSRDYASWSSSFVFVGGAAVVPTPSAGPSAAPGAGYGANTLLFSDDFNDTSGGWEVADGPNGRVAYESEKLAVHLTGNVSYLSTADPIASTPWDVVRIEATLTSTGGTGANYAGLLCGSSAEDAVGAVVGTDGLQAFIQRTGANYAGLESTQTVAGSLLQNDVPARLTLECAGTSTGSLRLRISLNGTLVSEYSGDDGPQNFQTVSVYVEGKAGASFTLDDVSVFGGNAAGLPALATPEMAALLAHVPAAFNVGCREVTTLSAGEVISVSCSPDLVTGYITYTQFETEDNVTDKWLGDLDFFAEGVSGSDCSNGPCLVAWERGGFVEGRYFANNYTGVDPNGLIAKWFDESLLIEAGLVVYETTFAELYDLALQAGPTP